LGNCPVRCLTCRRHDGREPWVNRPRNECVICDWAKLVVGITYGTARSCHQTYDEVDVSTSSRLRPRGYYANVSCLQPVECILNTWAGLCYRNVRSVAVTKSLRHPTPMQWFVHQWRLSRIQSMFYHESEGWGLFTALWDSQER
jgi:hypothetical protein